MYLALAVFLYTYSGSTGKVRWRRGPTWSATDIAALVFYLTLKNKFKGRVRHVPAPLFSSSRGPLVAASRRCRSLPLSTSRAGSSLGNTTTLAAKCKLERHPARRPCRAPTASVLILTLASYTRTPPALHTVVDTVDEIFLLYCVGSAYTSPRNTYYRPFKQTYKVLPY